ncbi:MAG: hypothetical protein IKL36_00920 [Clostridia bacterium]|nr:hypothetical protein [Clostridia bacterium]
MTNHIDASRQLLDMKVLPDYETVREIINIFAQRYSWVSVTSIGETTLGKSLYMIDLGAPDAESEVLYVASHSALDYVTTLILLRFINEYCEYYKNSSIAFGINIKKLFQSRCIHVIPCLNADGIDIHLKGIEKSCVLYERLWNMSGGDFSKWESNARGVDLRYNYDSGFYNTKNTKNNKTLEAGSDGYRGVLPESESETGALANYLRFNENIKAVISLQTSGSVIEYTSGGKCSNGAYSIAKQMQLLSGYSIDEPKYDSPCGRLIDWVIEKIGVPMFAVGCGEGINPVPVSEFYKIYSEMRRTLFSFPLLI